MEDNNQMEDNNKSRFQKERELIQGVIAGVPTVFDENNRVDVDETASIARWLVDNGIVNGSGALLIGGAIGQFMTMTNEERKAVHEACVEAVRGEVPTIVGCQTSGTDLAIDLATHAKKIGATAVQLAPPHYYFSPQIGPDDVINFFKDIAHEADIAMVAYHNYWASVGIGPETLARLVEEVPNVVACKWRGRTDAEAYTGYRLCSKKVNMLENQHHMMLGGPHQLGSRAIMSVRAVVWPEYDLKVWSLMEAGQYTEAGDLLQKLAIPLDELAYRVPGEFSNVFAYLRELRGFKSWVPRRPSRPLPDWAKQEIYNLFEDAGAPFLNK